MGDVSFGVDGSSGGAVSALGFGCAGLLGRASRAESVTAVRAALDAGITFFDTARSYGYGESEGLLGELFEGQRQRLTICTKFGIVPAARSWRSRVLPVARRVVKAFPALRKAAQRQAGTQFVGGQFSVASLTVSLETSLRRLKTDYVDMLLMHGAPESVLEQDDLLEALARLVESGKVRKAGISAELPVIAHYLTTRPAMLTTAQFALNITNLRFVEETERHGDLLLVANHPYGGPGGVGATRAAIEGLCGRAELPETLREKLKGSVGDPQLLPELLFHLLLDGTGVSAVVAAMMQLRHIESNVRAMTECRFSSEELKAMRAVLAGM